MDAAQLCRAILQRLNKFELDIQDLRKGQTQILERLSDEHYRNANDIIVEKKPPSVILAEGRAEKRADNEQELRLRDSGPRLSCLTAERPKMPHRRLPTRRGMRNQSEPPLPSWRISTHVRKQPMKTTSLEAMRLKTAQKKIETEKPVEALPAKSRDQRKEEDKKLNNTDIQETTKRDSPAHSPTKQPTRTTRQPRRNRGVSCPPKVGNRIKSIFGKLSKGGRIPLGGFVGQGAGPYGRTQPKTYDNEEPSEQEEEEIVIEEIDASEETITFQEPTSSTKKIQLTEAQEFESDSTLPSTADLVPSAIDFEPEPSGESDSPSEEAIRKLRAKLTKSKSPKYQAMPRKSVVGLFKSCSTSIHQLTQSQEPDDAIVAELRKKMKNDTGSLTEAEQQQIIDNEDPDEGSGKEEIIENARNALFALKSVIEGQRKSKAKLEKAEQEKDEKEQDEETSEQAVIETITVEEDDEAKIERRPSLKMISHKKILTSERKSPNMGEKRISERKLKRKMGDKKLSEKKLGENLVEKNPQKRSSDKSLGSKKVSEKKIKRMGDRKASEKRLKRRSVKIDKNSVKESKTLLTDEERKLIDKQIEKEERELMAKMALEEDERVRLIREKLAKEEKKKQERIQRRLEQKAKNEALARKSIRAQQQREKDRMETMAFQKKIEAKAKQEKKPNSGTTKNTNIPRRPMRERSKSHSRDNRLRSKINAGVSKESKDKGGKSPRGRMKRKSSRVNGLISFWNTDK